jgi:hypothetical protein
LYGHAGHQKIHRREYEDEGFYSNSNYKTTKCHNYANCRYGKHCTFAHPKDIQWATAKDF